MEKSFNPNEEDDFGIDEFSNNPNEEDDFGIDEFSNNPNDEVGGELENIYEDFEEAESKLVNNMEEIKSLDNLEDLDRKTIDDEDENISDELLSNEIISSKSDNSISENMLSIPSSDKLAELLKPNNSLLTKKKEAVVIEFEKVNPKDAFHQLSLMQKAMGQKVFILNYIKDRDFKDINLDDLLNLDDFKENLKETEKLNKSISELISNESLDNDNETIKKLYKLRSIESLIEDSISYEKFNADFENFKKEIKKEIEKQTVALIEYAKKLNGQVSIEQKKKSRILEKKNMEIQNKAQEAIDNNKLLINYFNDKLQEITSMLGKDFGDSLDSQEAFTFIEDGISELKLSLNKEINNIDKLKITIADWAKANEELENKLEQQESSSEQDVNLVKELTEKDSVIVEKEKEIERLEDIVAELKTKTNILEVDSKRLIEENDMLQKNNNINLADTKNQASDNEDLEDEEFEDEEFEDEESSVDTSDNEEFEDSDKDEEANKKSNKKKKVPKWLIIIVSIVFVLAASWGILVFLFADDVNTTSSTPKQMQHNPVAPVKPITPVKPIAPIATNKTNTISYNYEKDLSLEQFEIQNFDIYSTNFKKIRVNGKDFKSGDVINGYKFIKADSSGKMLFIKDDAPVYIKMKN